MTGAVRWFFERWYGSLESLRQLTARTAIHPQYADDFITVAVQTIVVSGLLTVSSYPAVYAVFPDQKGYDGSGVTLTVTDGFAYPQLTLAYRVANALAFLLSLLTILMNLLLLRMLALYKTPDPEMRLQVWVAGMLDFLSRAGWFVFMCSLLVMMLATCLGAARFTGLGYAVAVFAATGAVALFGGILACHAVVPLKDVFEMTVSPDAPSGPPTPGVPSGSPRFARDSSSVTFYTAASSASAADHVNFD